MSAAVSLDCLGLWILDTLDLSRHGTQACALAGAWSCQTSSMPLHSTTLHLPGCLKSMSDGYTLGYTVHVYYASIL